MNKSVIAMAFIVATTSGCTVFVRTNPVAVASASRIPPDRALMFQEKKPGSYLMTITRDEGFMGGGCFIGLEVDGKLSARFNPGDTASFYIPTATPAMQVVPDPLGQGLCGIGGWTPVPENYVLKANQDNLFRISLGAYRRPRLLPALK